MIAAFNGGSYSNSNVLAQQTFERYRIGHGDGLRVERIDGLWGSYGVYFCGCRPAIKIEGHEIWADAQFNLVKALDGRVVSGAGRCVKVNNDFVAAFNGFEIGDRRGYLS